jgi:molecular chaperone Hsp33
MDLVLPFTVGGGAFRGRLVRLAEVADAAIAPHRRPDPVARLIGEAVALAAVLGSSLKFDGVITVQTASDGPVKRIVADMTSGGDLRASIAADDDRLSRLLAEDPAPGFTDLVGAGRLALTVDQGEHTDRYQGIVDLSGGSFAAAASEYFHRSEQIDTALTLAAAPPADGFGWRAGGLLLQRLPVAGGELADRAAEADAWETARILHGSLTARELLDPTLAATEVLRRLFHAEGLSVYSPSEVRFSCRCSRERLAAVLASLPPADLAAATNERGVIEVTCDFCKTRYAFAANDLKSEVT